MLFEQWHWNQGQINTLALHTAPKLVLWWLVTHLRDCKQRLAGQWVVYLFRCLWSSPIDTVSNLVFWGCKVNKSTLVPTSLCFYSWESESQSSISFCSTTRHDSIMKSVLCDLFSSSYLWPRLLFRRCLKDLIFVSVFQESLSHGLSNG